MVLETPIITYDKLIGRIIEKCHSREEFAEQMGWDMSYLSRKLNQRVGFSIKDIFTICNLLEIQTEEIGEYFFTQKV